MIRPVTVRPRFEFVQGRAHPCRVDVESVGTDQSWETGGETAVVTNDKQARICTCKVKVIQDSL